MEMLPLLTMYSKYAFCRWHSLWFTAQAFPCILQVVLDHMLIHPEFLFVFKWSVSSNKLYFSPKVVSFFLFLFSYCSVGHACQ